MSLTIILSIIIIILIMAMVLNQKFMKDRVETCLLYTSDAADDSLRVDLGGRGVIKKNKL
ncbi:hypothetical protein CDFC105_31830 [Clostridioides difficile]|nr:hypothetical protein CDFC105_31830 [Clostridioides difficile]